MFPILLDYIIGIINIIIGLTFLRTDYPVLSLVWLIQVPFNFYIASENLYNYIEYKKHIAILSYKKSNFYK